MDAKKIAIESIKHHEGYSEELYTCPAGYLTIGWGCNLSKADKKIMKFISDDIDFDENKPEYALKELFLIGIRKRTATDILNYQVDNIIRTILGSPRSVDWYEALSENRKAIIIEMVFQLGFKGMLSFKKMILAIKRKDFVDAGAEMKDSKWFDQTENRCRNLAYKMQKDL